MQVIKGQGIQDGDAVYLLDGPNFTKCPAAVTEHVSPKKVYKTQKKYIRNIRKPLRLGLQEWILQTIKLNDYLESFLIPDGVTAKKISQEEFADVLEGGVPYQWKLEFKKEGFDSSSSTLKEFLD
eukprot:7391116-Ditylum_brightwellii.AAC.1